MSALQNLEPQKAFAFFEEMCQIPHGSGNEKGLSDYLVAFAEVRGLVAIQDAAHNVIIKKDGTRGYESAPPVILQGHIDMVCEKNNDTVHDFMKDPIKLHIDGDFIKTEGTTMGADNCATIAMALAILDADDIPHPPLEVVCTSGEEVGMIGAAALDYSALNAKRIMNLDSEEEGIFTVGCAGGMRATMTLPAEYESIKPGYVSAKVGLRGLFGGHSGGDIHLERGNANRLLGRLLHTLCGKADVYVGDFNGGAQDNAIPREADAVISYPESEAAVVETAISELEKQFQNEYRVSDNGLSILFEKLSQTVTQAFTKETTHALLVAILLYPNGVLAKSLEMQGGTETSNNLGVVRSLEGAITLTGALRSSVVSRKYALLDQVKLLAELVSATVETRGDYPAWEFRAESPLRETAAALFEEMYGKKPEVVVVHGGLECGMFAENIENADIISFGPDIFDNHTPNERMSIPSFKRSWEYLLALLAKLNK